MVISGCNGTVAATALSIATLAASAATPSNSESPSPAVGSHGELLFDQCSFKFDGATGQATDITRAATEKSKTEEALLGSLTTITVQLAREYRHWPAHEVSDLSLYRQPNKRDMINFSNTLSRAWPDPSPGLSTFGASHGSERSSEPVNTEPEVRFDIELKEKPRSAAMSEAQAEIGTLGVREGASTQPSQSYKVVYFGGVFGALFLIGSLLRELRER